MSYVVDVACAVAGDARFREAAPPVFFMFGAGVACVASIVAGAPAAAISSVALALLAACLLAMPGVSWGAWLAALVAAAVFPPLEALCVRLGSEPGYVKTWSYAGDKIERLSIPAWLVPLWACAGAFVALLFEAALAAVSVLLAGRDAAPTTASVLAAASALLGLAGVAVACIVLVPSYTTALVMAVLAVVAALVVHAAMGLRAAAAAALAGAAVGLSFPLLEALCARAWAYAGDGLLPVLGIPPWLFPLWTLIGVTLSFVANVPRSLAGGPSKN
jgi:hypothetical protein